MATGDGFLSSGARSSLLEVGAAAHRAHLLVLPLLSAVLLVLALPPFHVLPLAFVALVPVAVGLALLPPGPGDGARASLFGVAFGLAFWGFSLVWVPLEVGRHFSWALPAYGLLLTLLAGLSALFAWAVHRLYHGARIPLALAVPVAWVGVEWIRANFPMGLAFPWLGLGVTLTPWPWLLALAEWTGEGGVAFWLALANGWVAAELVRLRKRPSHSPTNAWRSPASRGVLAGLLLLPLFLGWARARSLPLLPGPTVVLVGTNVPRDLRSDPGASAREALGQIHASLRSARASPAADLVLLPEATVPMEQPAADLVLLPEATVPMALEGEAAEGLLEELGRMAAELGTPLVVGALGRVSTGAGTHALSNSAYLILPDGRVSQRYDKARLVPGMEAGGYRPGPGGETLSSSDWVYGPLICYESLFGSLARKARREGAHALLNLTSDIWFGEGDSYMGGVFLQQHPAHLVLRAVENRMPVARAANGGFSLVLDPLGRVSSSVLPPDGGLVTAQLLTTPGVTVFTRAGDLVGPGSLFLGIVLLLKLRLGRGLLRPGRSTDLPRTGG